MNVIVTGSGGFLGTHVCERLAALHKITLHRFNRREHRFGGRKIRELLSGADVIIHLAGVNRDTDSRIQKGNADFTLLLLRDIQRWAPDAKLIFASSSQVYTQSVYGKSKLQAEQHIAACAATHGIRSVILRFSNIYGPFCRPFYNSVIATFLWQIMHNQELVIHGTGSRKRDFLYVSDAVDAIQRAMSYNPRQPCEIYDICSGALVSLKKLLMILKHRCPVPVRVRFEASALPETDVKRTSYVRAQKAFGWRPDVLLPEGIQRILHQEYEVTD